MSSTDAPAQFVAPEGAYTYLEEHKPQHLTVSGANAAQYPTRISTATIRFQTKASSATPGLTALLGGGKDTKAKEKERDKENLGTSTAENKDRDRESVSSSDNGDDRDGAGDLNVPLQDSGATNANTSAGEAGTSSNNGGQQQPQFTPTALFLPALNGVRRRNTSTRKMQNLRTTSSSFVTRLQTVEGLSKLIGHQSGDVTYLFYNASKSFIWTQAGLKLKASAVV